MIPSAQAHDPLGRGNLKVESSKLKVQVHSPGICRDIGDMFLCMLRKDACHTHKMASQLDIIMIRYESNLCVNHGLQSSQIVGSPDDDEEGEENAGFHNIGYVFCIQAQTMRHTMQYLLCD